MKEQSPEYIRMRAMDADALLKNPLLKEALEAVKESYITAIENCDLRDDNLKDKYMMGLKVLKSVTNQIRKHIETGKLYNHLEENSHE